MLTRRHVLRGTAAGAILLATGRATRAQADVRALSEGLATVLREALALGAAVRSGALSQTGWQDAIGPVLSRVPLDALRRELDLEALRRRARRVSRGCAVVPLTVPTDLGAGEGAAMRVFFFEAGRTDPPHVHFNSVTSHLVVEGRFRVQHWDRVREQPDGFVLRATHDRTVTVGESTSISEARDNAHWHQCLSRGVLLDVEQGRLDPSIPPRRRQMIDLSTQRADGEFLARAIGQATALHRYG
ncbi:MAG: hypothetical protein J0L92_09880 [Deltaproteobacteria bacterium]|nr:hypothetical protein [Deltaproteobacteria bacterium]